MYGKLSEMRGGSLLRYRTTFFYLIDYFITYFIYLYFYNIIYNSCLEQIMQINCSTYHLIFFYKHIHIVMKHANKFILLCTLCLFLSCSLHEVESDSKNSSMVELSPSPVLDRILGLGILKENIKEFKDYYLAEGDIIFLKCDTVIPDSSHLRQRRHKYLVTQKGIQVYLDAEFGWEEYSSPALDQALKAFNDIHSSIFFSRTYDRSQANIIISDH